MLLKKTTEPTLTSSANIECFTHRNGNMYNETHMSGKTEGAKQFHICSMIRYIISSMECSTNNDFEFLSTVIVESGSTNRK